MNALFSLPAFELLSDINAIHFAANTRGKKPAM